MKGIKPMSTPIRILIVDDNPILRAGFRTLLAPEPSVAVVGSAANGAEAIAHAKTLLPDLILLDLVMPSKSSLTTITAFQQQTPAVRILVLTDLVDDDIALKAIQAGASGCLLKTAPIPELIRAIHTAYAGETPLHPRLTNQLINQLTAQRNPLRLLSKREQEVLQLTARGLSYQEIAATLFIDKQTVYTYTGRTLRKLRLANREQAAHYAFTTGLAKLEPSPAS
jgi:DNA-binding NarL/FixJ family response regulator